MNRLLVMAAGALVSGGTPALGAPVCILNQSGQALFLAVDNLAGQRVAKLVDSGGSLCLKAPDGAKKAVVGVFLNGSAEEGCSRLAHPGQPETLLDFAAFDNCRWIGTNRVFK